MNMMNCRCSWPEEDHTTMNETITIRIEDLTREGEGVGRLDGKAVFTAGALPGETVRARIREEKKNYAKADLVSVETASPDRTAPFCPYAGECGGCPLACFAYDAELRQKERWVRDALERIGGIPLRVEGPSEGETGAAEEGAAVFLPIIGMDEPYRYRNKAELKIGPNGEVGYHARRTNRVVDCAECRIQSEATERAAKAMRGWLAETRFGGLRGMTVRTAATGSVMAVLETDAKDLEAFRIPDLQYLADLLTDTIEADDRFSFRSFTLTNGRDTAHLAGAKTIRETACGLQWEVSPRSFFQVNTAQMERLYGVVREFLLRPPLEGEKPLPENPVILDLYCGTGTIGLSLSDLADHVLGVESVRPAVIDANRNAVINGIVNAEFLCGKAEEVLPKMFETAPLGGEDYRPCLVFPSGFTAPADVVIVDPPRAGCDPRLLEAAALAGPSRLIYVSCDPATLARDLKVLGEKGYVPRLVRPVDMFPHTAHVETVVLLTRNLSEELQ